MAASRTDTSQGRERGRSSTGWGEQPLQLRSTLPTPPPGMPIPVPRGKHVSRQRPLALSSLTRSVPSEEGAGAAHGAASTLRIARPAHAPGGFRPNVLLNRKVYTVLPSCAQGTTPHRECSKGCGGLPESPVGAEEDIRQTATRYSWSQRDGRSISVPHSLKDNAKPPHGRIPCLRPN